MRTTLGLLLIMTAFSLSSCSSGDNAPLPPPGKAAATGYSKCQAVEPDGDELCDPSVIELIVRPEWYEGREVVVAGVLDTSSESFALFASTEDQEQQLTRKALDLIARQGADLRTAGLSGRWVWVRGRFLPRQRSGGHASWGGTLVEVTSIWYSGPPGPPAPAPLPRVR